MSSAEPEVEGNDSADHNNPGQQLSQAGAGAQENVQQSLAGLETKLQSLKGEIQKAVEKSGAADDASGP